MSAILGIDLGGTGIKSGVLESDGNFSQTRTTPTPQNDPTGQQAISVLSQIIEQYKTTNEFAAVGLVVPGLVDSETGVSVFSGTLGWRNLPLVEPLQAATGLPVFLEHDVTAAGIAELHLGAARHFKDSILMQVGTGIAACYVIDGQIFKPHSKMAEVGHAPIFNDRPCPCGLKGCLEMTGSGGALTRNYLAVSGERLSPLEIVSRASSGEALAAELWDEFAAAMAFGIAWLASTTGPEAVIFGGGIAQAGDSLISAVDRHLDKRLSIHLRPRLVLSELNDQAAAIGSALSAQARLS